MRRFTNHARTNRALLFSVALLGCAAQNAYVTTGVTTLAGGGLTTFADGAGTGASFKGPSSVVVDASGNVIVADSNHHRIRKVTPGGVVTTLAGSGSPAFADGTGTRASFFNSYGMAVDVSGNLVVADNGNARIRKMTPGGVVSTLAGSGSIAFADGTGAGASFAGPCGVALDAVGNAFVGDTNNHRIRKVTPGGVVSTLAGSGSVAFADGTGAGASFYSPMHVAIDISGNVIVADMGNHRIRKVTPGGVVSTLAGSGTGSFFDGAGIDASFNNPRGVAIDLNGNILVADWDNSRIRRILPGGAVSTLAGNGFRAFVDGAGEAASFNRPTSGRGSRRKRKRVCCGL
jgi:sugar lactone lactonase YvrE